MLDEGAQVALQSIVELQAADMEAWERAELLDLLAEHVAYLASF
jgi:hypothetical protein